MRCFLRYILFFVILFSCVLECFAQTDNITPQEEKRLRNRRIADSLYYVHTLKKQEDSIRQLKIEKIKSEPEKPIQLKNLTKSDTARTMSKSDTPSSTLYQNKWFNERVKSDKITMKDLPDEIILRLDDKKGYGEFCFPYKGKKTSGYGWRWGRPHTGLDIALNTGDKVYAAFDGVVRVAKFNGGYGNMVLIRHYNNLETLYGHLSEIKVKLGQKVKAGDVIGLGGSTGHSTGPHLHFECRLLYACFDPEWIVDMNTYKLKTKFVRIDKSYFGVSANENADGSKKQPSKLSKVNKLLSGTKYVSNKEFAYLIQQSEQQKKQPVKINNDDKSTWRYYRVKEGDTIENISQRYNIAVKDIMTINGMKDKNLKINSRIRIR